MGDVERLLGDLAVSYVCDRHAEMMALRRLSMMLLDRLTAVMKERK